MVIVYKLVTVLMLLVGPVLGQDTELQIQELGLEATNAEIPLFGSAITRARCPKLEKCKRIRGKCKKKGSCPDPAFSCTKRCICCLPKCWYACTKEKDPVCASEGINYKTFGNPCLFYRAVKCDPKYKDYTFQHKGRCECPMICTDEWNPVCGGDRWSSKTFSNQCHLDAAIKCDPQFKNYKFLNDRECRCSLQMVTGPCKASFPRWYYDVDHGQCRFFIYGGCLGNANRFDTYEECTNKCGYRPYNSTAATWENYDYLIKDSARCNDDYDDWKPELKAQNYEQAKITCENQGMELACPQFGLNLIIWLAEHAALTEEYWFAGKQGTYDYFNYMYWENNEEIERLTNGLQLWNKTNPKYPEITACVKGKDILRTDDCNTLSPFFCSPKQNK